MTDVRRRDVAQIEGRSRETETEGRWERNVRKTETGMRRKRGDRNRRERLEYEALGRGGKTEVGRG